MNHEESYRVSISARFCGTRSDRRRFSPVRREGHDYDQRSDDLRSVHELHHLNVLLSVPSDMLPNNLLPNSLLLRSHAVL